MQSGATSSSSVGLFLQIRTRGSMCHLMEHLMEVHKDVTFIALTLEGEAAHSQNPPPRPEAETSQSRDPTPTTPEPPEDRVAHTGRAPTHSAQAPGTCGLRRRGRAECSLLRLLPLMPGLQRSLVGRDPDWVPTSTPLTYFAIQNTHAHSFP